MLLSLTNWENKDLISHKQLYDCKQITCCLLHHLIVPLSSKLKYRLFFWEGLWIFILFELTVAISLFSTSLTVTLFANSLILHLYSFEPNSCSPFHTAFWPRKKQKLTVKLQKKSQSQDWAPSSSCKGSVPNLCCSVFFHKTCIFHTSVFSLNVATGKELMSIVSWILIICLPFLFFLHVHSWRIP